MAITNPGSEVDAAEAQKRFQLAQARELIQNLGEAVTEEGDQLILLDAAMADRLRAMRQQGESLGDVVRRLVDKADGKA